MIDASFKNKNPFAGGNGYFCSSCQKVFDSSLVHLHKKPKAVTSTIGDIRNQDLVFESVPEDKGISPIVEDEYKKYDPEESADEHLIAQGATIVDSRIVLTDSSGQNRIMVKHNQR